MSGKRQRQKKGVKNVSSTLPSLALSLFPLESQNCHQSSMFPPLGHKHNSFQLMNSWHRTHMLSHMHFHLVNHTNPNKPLSPLSHGVLTPQAMSVDCDTRNPRKCTHAYTMSIVMNNSLRAKLTSWDHFLLLFFFLWPFTFINLFFPPSGPSHTHILFLTSSLMHSQPLRTPLHLTP